jgi:nitrile hydratase
MTRVHDMGGRFGDGPVLPEPEDHIFDAEWHKRALALTLAAGALGKWNIDTSRHARESLAPKDYARFGYYEKWIAALADLLVKTDVVSRAELVGALPDSRPLVEKALTADAVPTVLAKGGPADRPSDVIQMFQPGAMVLTRHRAENTAVNGGHTRLPSYASGAKGQILRCHGTHVLPDCAAHGLGDCAEPLYAVAFAASELWAHPENPRDQVVLDLWQSYLEPTP